MTHADCNGLEVLDREECYRLLGTATLGRVAVTADALPVVLPVNFRLDGDRIVFRTSPGTKLEAATRNAVVAFEADDADPDTATGWSVLAQGVADEVRDPGEQERLRALPIPRWVPDGDEETIVAIDVRLISGRRVPAGARARTGTGDRS